MKIEFQHPLIVPQVNINGTSRDMLIEQLLDVSRKLNDAINAMNAALPHDRDFQTMKNAEQVSIDARNAWVFRMRVLLKLQAEVLAHALSIKDQ